MSLIDCDHRTPPSAGEGYPYIAIPQLKDGHVTLDGVRRISCEHLDEWTKKLKPREYDVIVVRRCNSGLSAVVPRGAEWAIGQNLVVLRADGRHVRPGFLRWLVRGEDWWEQVRKYINVGAVFDSLKCRDIPNFEVRVPPMPEQDRICAVLDAIDHRIDLLRQTNATLESIAQALFKSWFIDFDPVRAKAEGREPEGMDAATASLFPAEFEESALGLIPKGWRAGDLEMLCSDGGGFIQTGPFGSQLHASDYEAEGVPVVMPQDLEGRRISTERVARVSSAHVERLSRHKLMVGDVVFSRRGDVGRHAAVTAEETGWLCGTGCLLVRPGGTWPSPAYVSQALATSDATEWLKRHAVGATMPNLNTGILGSLPLLLPRYPVLAAFEVVADALEGRISANRAQGAQLAALRDTLLPRLISGKLRLPDPQPTLLAFA